MALQTLEGDLIPMRPAKETLTRYAVLLLGAAILSFGLFNVHSQSGVTEGGVLGTTLLLHHWFGISPGVSEFVIDVICYALGFRFLGKAFFKYAIAASAGFACFYMLWERVGPVLPDLSGQPLIAALLGGVFVGVGVGLVVRAGGASGGDDVLALLLNKFTKLTLSKSYFMTDAIVLALSLTYIPAGRIVFSFITVTLSSYNGFANIGRRFDTHETRKGNPDTLCCAAAGSGHPQLRLVQCPQPERRYRGRCAGHHAAAASLVRHFAGR